MNSDFLSVQQQIELVNSGNVKEYTASHSLSPEAEIALMERKCESDVLVYSQTHRFHEKAENMFVEFFDKLHIYEPYVIKFGLAESSRRRLLARNPNHLWSAMAKKKLILHSTENNDQIKLI